MTKKEVKNKLKQWGFKVTEFKDSLPGETQWVAEKDDCEFHDIDFGKGMSEKKLIEMIMLESRDHGRFDKTHEIRTKLVELKKALTL